MSSLVPFMIEHAAHRHTVLAGNIANAMTPNYKPKDVFIDQVEMAKRASEALSVTHKRHMQLDGTSGEGGLIKDRDAPLQPNADGSWIDVEVERALMMQNANYMQGLTRAATYYLRVQQLSVS